MSAKKPSLKKRMPPILNSAVAEIFASYPAKFQQRLLSLRQLILKTAADTPNVDELEETLRWNEPAYLTSKSKSGSSIRINRVRDSQSYAVYFNCNTNLVDTFRTMFPTEFHYDGDRAIVFDIDEKIPTRELQMCLSMALTYHLQNKSKRKKQ